MQFYNKTEDSKYRGPNVELIKALLHGDEEKRNNAKHASHVNL